MARKCIKKMKIRLILPICNSDYLGKWYYCEDSFLKKRERLKILENAMLYKNNIDLVATSNNFFGFNFIICLHNSDHIEPPAPVTNTVFVLIFSENIL